VDETLFDHIDYLKAGTVKQQQAYELLKNNCVIDLLKDYNPILAGTIPLNIDIEGSDLDILCEFKNESNFINAVQKSLSHFKNFTLSKVIVNEEQTVIANFLIEDFELEIFGQAVPVRDQAGYKHMIIEYKILQEKGGEFRNQIIALKKQGYKTEPAFAKLLGLNGDPYISLLHYKV
jgi:hypothetical protein